MKEKISIVFIIILRENFDGIHQNRKAEQNILSSLSEKPGRFYFKYFQKMVNKIVFSGLFIFLIFCNGLNAQVSGQSIHEQQPNTVKDEIRKRVASAKSTGKFFQQVKLFDDNSKSGVQNFSAQVSKGVTFDINTQLSAAFLKNKYEHVELEIPVGAGR